METKQETNSSINASNEYRIEDIFKMTKTNKRGQALRRAVTTFKDEKQIIAIIDSLLKDAETNTINESDNNPNVRKTALHYAIEKNNYKAIEYLLERGASYDLEDANHNTALCLVSKSTNIKTRALLFKKVALDAFKQTEDKYYFANKLTSQESQEIYKSFNIDNLAEEDIFNGLFRVVGAYLDSSLENFKAVPKEMYKLHKLVKFFSQLNLSKKHRSNYIKLYNYCQQQCDDLAFELFRFKAFRSGSISMWTIKYTWPNNKAHVVLFLNGLPSNIAADTILCNPNKKEFYCGEVEIQKYFKDRNYFTFCNPELSVLTSNLYPNFEKFVKGKNEYRELLVLLNNAYLEEAAISKDQYKGTIRYTMEKFTHQIYNKFQVNFSLDEILLNILKITDQQTISSIKQILERPLAPSSIAPTQTFYGRNTTAQELSHESAKTEVNKESAMKIGCKT